MKGILLILLLLYPAVVFGQESININTASPEQLQIIAGVGPVTAQKIIDGRPFYSLGELARISGIGDKTLAKIKAQGLAYINAEALPQKIIPSAAPISPPKIYPTGIFINEIMPRPDSPVLENQWVELHNSNSFAANLSGWKIKDITGATKIYTLPKNSIIPANGYFVVRRVDTKIVLGAGVDGITLLRPDNTTADSVAYEGAPKNQSYARTTTAWQWSDQPTPGQTNTFLETIAKPLQKSKKSDTTASISQNPWIPLSVAAGLIVLAGSIFGTIQFIKYKNHVRP